MKVIRDPRKMNALSVSMRDGGKRIGFVPTMGYLHEGHLKLVEEGLSDTDFLVVSIFVNPLQFGPTEDFERYPRDEKRDLRLLRSRGVHAVFIPDYHSIYPKDFSTTVDVESLSSLLCGKSRPGHFKGVATIVLKLFNIVQPHIAFFGEKDYQQLLVVRRMVKDLNLNIEIRGIPTVREEDGLAMSSRNSYLTQKERQSASLLYKALSHGKRAWMEGKKSSSLLIKEMMEILDASPDIKIDYLKVCDPNNLQEIEKVEDRGIILVAAYIGNTRLIDNILLSDQE